MKRTAVHALSAAVFVAFALCGSAFAAEKEEFVARGAKLFADPSLGANGKSCATCHGDGAVWAGKPRFPKFALGRVRTLDQAIQTCIVNPLAGKALAWDDERLSALAIFIDGIYAKAPK